jgi:hypothetical protein
LRTLRKWWAASAAQTQGGPGVGLWHRCCGCVLKAIRASHAATATASAIRGLCVVPLVQVNKNVLVLWKDQPPWMPQGTMRSTPLQTWTFLAKASWARMH